MDRKRLIQITVSATVVIEQVRMCMHGSCAEDSILVTLRLLFVDTSI